MVVDEAAGVQRRVGKEPWGLVVGERGGRHGAETRQPCRQESQLPLQDSRAGSRKAHGGASTDTALILHSKCVLWREWRTPVKQPSASVWAATSP